MGDIHRKVLHRHTRVGHIGKGAHGLGTRSGEEQTRESASPGQAVERATAVVLAEGRAGTQAWP